MLRGRSSRRVYWTYLVAEAVVWVAAGAAIDGFDIDLLDPAHRTWAMAAAGLAALSLACGAVVGIRRLHDTDRSGWYLALTLVPVIGWIVAATMLNAPGSPGPNRFGAAPRPF